MKLSPEGHMSIGTALKKTLFWLDETYTELYLPARKEQAVLLSFLIHGVFQDTDELKGEALDPQQGLTVEMLRDLLEHFTRAGYKFVSPEDWGGFSTGGKYVLLTFDDGYYNNIRALPLLEEFNVPAVFFISSDHVKLGKAFWWDVVYRELKNRGQTDQEIRHAGARYKQLKTSDAESDLLQQFGKYALSPASDLDRPFTVSELKEFASHRLVFIGNHTTDHAILTNYSAAEIREQICGCQEAVSEMTGKTPKIIAYPNGYYSQDILEAAREAGLRFGLGVQAGSNTLPLNGGTAEAMTMKRFTLWGNRPIEAQCRVSRSRLSLYRLLISTKHRTGPSGKGN